MNFLDTHAIVTSPQAPLNEKVDAQAELFNDFLGEIKENLIPSEDIRELQSYLNLEKSVNSPAPITPYQREMGETDTLVAKAVQAYPAGMRPVMNRKGGHKSYLYMDELGIISGGHLNFWVEKLSPFGFTALKMMVEGCPVLNAAILARIRQVNSMSCIYDSQDEHPLGFICLPKGKKVGDKLTEEEKKVAEDIQNFIMNCGDEPDPRKRKWIKHRENMTGFIGKLVRDTLTCDAAPIETEMTLAGNKISGFYNIPAETVRIAHEEGYIGDDRIVALQIFNDMVVSFYTPQDIIYEVRNPRSDITASKYGYGETEMIVKLVTSFLNTLTYNSSFFDRNNIPRGIMTVFGNFDETQLNQFKRQWNAQLSGPAQRWRLPVFVSQNKEAAAHYERIDQTIDEMQFAKWMTFLVSIICAIMGLSPEEINFDSFTSRTTSALNGQDTTEKLASAKDKGLEPLVSWVEQIYNEFLIPIYNPNYLLRYMGLHREEQKNIFELKKLAYTVNEARHALGEDEMEDPDIGEAPLNPVLMQVYSAKLQQQQQEAMGQGPEAQEHGLPQDVLDGLRDDEEGGGDGEANGTMGRQSNGDVSGGAEEKRDVRKAQERFLVMADLKPVRRTKWENKDDGWKW